MTSAAGTPSEQIANLKDRVAKTTGPVSLSSLLKEAIGAAQTDPIEAVPWAKLIFDSMVDNVEVGGSAGPSDLTFTGDFEAYDRVRGAVSVQTLASGEPYFVCSFSFQPSYVNNIPELSFLNQVNPGPFTVALASLPVEKFPLQVPGGEEQQNLFQGVNFFSSIAPTGVVQDVLSVLLNTKVDKLSLSGGLELKAKLSEEPDQAVDVTPAVKIRGAVEGTSAFIGIDAIQVTESAVTLSSTVKEGASTKMSTGLESLFTVATPDGAHLKFKGEVTCTVSEGDNGGADDQGKHSDTAGEGARDTAQPQIDVSGSLAITEDCPTWTDALGVKGLDLGGLGLQVDIKKNLPTIGIRVDSFKLGGKINGSGAVVTAIIEAPPYLDFTKCMVSLSVDQLPIGDLWEALAAELNVTVPEQVGNIAIDNARIYAAPQETKIAGETFPPGFKLAGTLKVLGWSGSVEGAVKFSTLLPAAKTFNITAFSVPTELSAFAYFDPLPLSGDGFLALTQPEGALNSRFPAFPQPDLLAPPIPSGAKMAVQIGLEKQEAQIAMEARLMNSVSADCIAVVGPNGASGYFNAGVHAGSFGAVSCTVGVQSWPSGYSIQNTSFSFTANVSSSSIGITSPVKATLDGVTLSAEFTLDLDATMSALPSAAFDGQASGSFDLGGKLSVSLPRFAVSSPPESLRDLLGRAVKQAESALDTWFLNSANVAKAITYGWVKLPPVTIPVELPVKIDIPVHVDPPHLDPPHVDPPHIRSPF